MWVCLVTTFYILFHFPRNLLWHFYLKWTSFWAVEKLAVTIGFAGSFRALRWSCLESGSKRSYYKELGNQTSRGFPSYKAVEDVDNQCLFQATSLQLSVKAVLRPPYRAVWTPSTNLCNKRMVWSTLVSMNRGFWRLSRPIFSKSF